MDREIDPYANEPGRWGASLLNDAELVAACLDAARPSSVVEIGAFAGDLTAFLLDWAGGRARICAIDPEPRPPLVALAERHAELELVRAPSLEALPRIPPPDAVIVDGDHNWWTVSEELRTIAERAEGPLPLVLLHDVCWPHARRDDYFDPGAIPAEHRHPWVDGGWVLPGDPGIAEAGLPYRHPAAREGGPRNGVLTAVEDFVAAREGLRLAVVPAFFGLGVVWDAAAPWADELAAAIEPWDRHPLLDRLEQNRVHHLGQAAQALHRAGRQEEVLRRLLDSRAFWLAERLSRLRHRAGIARNVTIVSREEIRRALDEP
jgi:methyltransferase family protein